jgi:hypothetical protein
MNRNCNLQSGQKLETDDQLSMHEKQNLQKEQNNTMTLISQNCSFGLVLFQTIESQQSVVQANDLFIYLFI